MSARFNFLTLFKFITFVVIITADDPLVTLKFGQVRGSSMQTIEGRHFSAFRGIPYAKPPIGDLRFKEPQPLTEPWEIQPLDASKDGPECIQFTYLDKKILGQEDCLTLNVYTPRIKNSNEDNGLPVMVYIHGGGSNYGSATSFMYGPMRLMDHDVVLVTFNYRLNVFGFLSNHDEFLPGNFGLLDQVEALIWVKQNIKYFGGDPARVTLFGESAGGADVILHLLSPLSKGLFHGAIAMSGTPLCPWSYIYEPKERTTIFAQKIGCGNVADDSEKLVDCLRKIPADEIINVVKTFLVDLLAPWGPVFDGTFLMDDPINLFRRRKFASRVPLMIGINKDEGLTFTRVMSGTNYPKYSYRWLQKATKLAVNVNDNHKLGKTVELINNQYFDHINISDTNQLRDAMTQMFTEGMFTAPHYETLPHLTTAGFEPYVYSYDYVTDHSIVKRFGVDSNLGVSHSDGLYYLFDSPYFFPYDYENKLDDNEKKFLKLWVNFATYSNPTPDGDGKELRTWPRASDKRIPVYHMDKKIYVEKYNPNDDPKVVFWGRTIIDALGAAEFVKDEL